MDLNSDLGEGYGVYRMGDDAAVLAVVTSANVACGFHAGDPSVMRRTVTMAAQRGVALGAHVSYPDLRGFGRTALALAPRTIRDDVLYQLGALAAFARAAGTEVSYLKAHGALYHRMDQDPEVAAAVVEALVEFDAGLALLTLAGGAAAEAALARGVAVVAEAFADRGYDARGRLVPRGSPGALLTDPAQAAAQAVGLATRGTVTAVTGEQVELTVGSLCVHGDTPAAVELARAVRRGLEEAGVPVAPFARAVR